MCSTLGVYSFSRPKCATQGVEGNTEQTYAELSMSELKCNVVTAEGVLSKSLILYSTYCFPSALLVLST